MSNNDLKTVFQNPPKVVYKRAKNLKDHLVRAKLPNLSVEEHNKAGSFKCMKSRCQTCQNVKNETKFSNKDSSKIFEIRKGPLNCDSQNVIYQIVCKTCGIQYIGSSKGAFRLRFNNYKSHHRTFLARQREGTLGRGKSVPQRELHSHFAKSDHKGLEDMQFTLIDSGPDNIIARKRETFWQYKLDTFEPNGLNIRNVPPGEFSWKADLVIPFITIPKKTAHPEVCLHCEPPSKLGPGTHPCVLFINLNTCPRRDATRNRPFLWIHKGRKHKGLEQSEGVLQKYCTGAQGLHICSERGRPWAPIQISVGSKNFLIAPKYSC